MRLSPLSTRLAVITVWVFAARGRVLPAQPIRILDEFDGTLGSWIITDPEGDLTLGSLDATGCAPESDSALADNTAANASNGAAFVRDCVNVTAGAAASFGGYIRFLTGQSTTGSANFEISWVEGFSCSGSVVDVEFSAPIVTTGSAGTWVSSRWTGTIPANANSGHIRLTLDKDDAGGTLSARFDSVFLAEGDFVWAEDFEIDATCRWSETVP